MARRNGERCPFGHLPPARHQRAHAEEAADEARALRELFAPRVLGAAEASDEAPRIRAFLNGLIRRPVN